MNSSSSRLVSRSGKRNSGTSLSLGILKIRVFEFQLEPGFSLAVTSRRNNSNAAARITAAVAQITLVGSSQEDDNGEEANENSNNEFVGKSATKQTPAVAITQDNRSFYWDEDSVIDFKADKDWYIAISISFMDATGRTDIALAPVLLPVTNNYRKQRIGVDVQVNEDELYRLKTLGLTHQKQKTSPSQQRENRISLGTIFVSSDFSPNHQSFRCLASGVANSVLDQRDSEQHIRLPIVEEVANELTTMLDFLATQQTDISYDDRLLLRLDVTCFEQMATYSAMSARFADFLRSSRQPNSFQSLFSSDKSSKAKKPSESEKAFVAPKSMPLFQVSSKIRSFFTSLQLNFPKSPALTSDLMLKLLLIYNMEMVRDSNEDTIVIDDIGVSTSSEMHWDHIIGFAVSLFVWLLQQSLMTCCLVHNTRSPIKVCNFHNNCLVVCFSIA
jgi:hypothetical protein